MKNDANRPPVGGVGEEEAAGGQKEQHRDKIEEGSLPEKKRRFADAEDTGYLRAQEAGQETARELRAGFLQGIGRRMGEAVWDALSRFGG